MTRENVAAALRFWWAEHRTTLLSAALILMAVASAFRLRNEFSRLLWEPGRTGAIDLKILHGLVQQWFAGRPVYREQAAAVHPPATYAMLWPFLGWLAVTPARWLWAATTVPALGWLVYLVVRESGAATPLERTCVALLPLSMYATSATIGNGQLIVHLLPPMVAGLLLLHRDRYKWFSHWLAAALMLASLVKPSISVPFFWIALFVSRTVRPALFVMLGYVGLTLFAASFQETGLLTLVRDWLASALAVAVRGGYANIPIWLGALGLKALVFPASFIVLAALGLWTYRHRHGDFWLLLGVTAIVARIWTYHRLYDDLLILIAMITLCRIAKRGPSDDGTDVLAGALLAITWVAALAPARFHAVTPWDWVFGGAQIMVWIAVLIFLLRQARREHSIRHGLWTQS